MLSFQPGMLYQYHYALAMQLGPVAGLSPSGGWLQAQAVVRIRQLHRDPSGDELLQVQVWQAVMLHSLSPIKMHSSFTADVLAFCCHRSKT